jgi:hypothetical protein
MAANFITSQYFNFYLSLPGISLKSTSSERIPIAFATMQS